jgi:23S rRNA pseudouridine1911/1915/1917 synthase
MSIDIIYEDDDVLVIDKPAGMVVFPEGTILAEKTLIDLLLEQYPDLKNVGEAPRYGIVHRLDKDTSGLLLVAKGSEGLIFLQKQFKNRAVEKKYLTLATGQVKEDFGKIETKIDRSPSDPRKQKAYSLAESAPASAREAVTEYTVTERFAQYTLLEVNMKTGRKHQIRCHLAYIHHPIAGDKVYGFKDSPIPENLQRQFLHASYIKIQLPSGQMKEFYSDLPEDLKNTINGLEKE